MSFKIPDRVHIMPVGYEEDRVVQAAKQLKAERVILLKHTENDSDGEKHFERAKQELETDEYDLDVSRCDFFDLYASLAKLNQLITQAKHDEVYINVSTGSKITAIAGMLAANIHDVTAYYAKAEDYGDNHIPKNIDYIFDIPPYPMDAPDQDHITVLKFLKENKHEAVSKKDLIGYCEKVGVSKFGKREMSVKAKYRLLDNDILEPLLDDGYVYQEKQGRTQVIAITVPGEELLKAFGHVPNSEYQEDMSNSIEA